jgi:hypothetical protein
MPSRESSLRNLEKARANWRPPRPWRSSEESQMIRDSYSNGSRVATRQAVWSRLGQGTWHQPHLAPEAGPGIYERSDQNVETAGSEGRPKILGLHPLAGVQSATERAWRTPWRVTFVAPGKTGKVF